MKRLLSLITVIVLMTSCSKIPDFDCMGRDRFPTNELVTNEKAKQIADLCCKYSNDKKVPAIQVSIVDRFGDTWTLSTGTTDKKRKNAVTNEHIFRLASITKTYTATIIIKLIEEGKLSLDGKLTEYFPNFENAPNVTIQNLLNHSSGIKELLTLPDILTSSTFFTDKIWNANEIVETIAKKDLVFETGTEYQYSNTNTVILGLIAEQVSGKKMEELYDEYIFEPLQIDNIKLLPQQSKPELLISGYDRALLPTPGLYEVSPENTAWASSAFTSGALVGNSETTAIFFHNLLMEKIVNENSLSTMKTFGQPNTIDNEHLSDFGLGLFKYHINGNVYYGHEGLFVGFDNIACFREKDKVTIVIFANMSSYDKFDLLKEIDNIL